jgi:hypothetical protein
MPKILKNIKYAKFIMEYETLLHIQSNKVGTILKHPRCIHDNVNILIKGLKGKIKKNIDFYFKM